jgi:hypothetical protein
MKPRMLVVLLALAVLVGCAGNGVAQDAEKKEVAQPRKVPPELMQKAQAQGTVRVIVDLNVPEWTSKKLSTDAELAQREKVADAQKKVIAELAGTQHKIKAQLKTVPALGLEAGPDALAALERSPLVQKVYEGQEAYLPAEKIELKEIPKNNPTSK